VWTQRYDPLEDWRLSTAAAAVPVLVLLVLLAIGRVSAWKAALTALLAACCVAWLVFKMPVSMVLSSVAVGLVFALLRIVWLIVAAVFLYEITVATGQFEIMKASVARLSADRRLQAVLVAFCFGAFIEGAAGFGAPVAISAAFLVGLGFDPFKAALLCLIANTAPVAWGSIGIPIRTLSTVTGLDVEALSATSGRILPFLSLIIPFWLVRVMTSWRETLAVWMPLAIIGGTFAAVQFLWSNFVGFELVDIVASVASMAAGVIAIHLFKPRETWRFERDDVNPATEPAGHALADASRLDLTAEGHLSAGRIARAWLPYGLLIIAVMLWGLPPIKSLGTPAVKEWLDTRFSWKPAVPSLHLLVAKGAAVTGHETALPEDREKAQLDIVPVVVHRHCRFPRSRLERVAAWPLATSDGSPAQGGGGENDAGFSGHLLHAGTGVRHEVLGHGRRTRTGIHPVGAAHLSDLRHAAGLAGRGTHRFGHFEQCPLRRLAKDHGDQARAQSHSDGVGEFDRRSDGEDDRRTIDRGCRGGHGRGRARRRAIAGCFLAQCRAGADCGRHRLGLRSSAAVDGGWRGRGDLSAVIFLDVGDGGGVRDGARRARE